MNHTSLFAAALSLLTAIPLTAAAQTAATDTETHIHLRNGKLCVIDNALIVRRDTINRHVRFHLRPSTDNSSAPLTHLIPLAEVASVSEIVKGSSEWKSLQSTFPKFVSYKFNNKFNGNLTSDAIGTFSADSSTISIAPLAIDRTLRASFQFSDADKARYPRAYVDSVRQESKLSYLRFDRPITYTLSTPGYERIELFPIKTQTTELPESDDFKKVAITAGMLSSNYPSKEPSDEIAHLVDNNLQTYFHSYWNAADRDLSIIPYVDIALPEALTQFQIGYVTRAQTSNNMPKKVTILTSNDGTNWTEIATFSDAEGLPTEGFARSFRSATIGRANAPFRYLRFRCDASTYRSYLCLAELMIYAYAPVGAKPKPDATAPYEMKILPYGRRVTVNATFATQTATSVPTIRITLKDGKGLSDIYQSKDTYRRADISIDGAGIWENLTDTVNIKGRGNSTWGMRKKPFRLKFGKGTKPFGLPKGKSWVLLANFLGAAHLNNPIAMKTAQLVETAAANHMIPVELYVNGQYMGAYSFTEQIGISGNSVEVDEETKGLLLELDTNVDNDPYFFDKTYGLRTKYKDPDSPEYIEKYGISAAREFYDKAESEFNKLTAAAQSGEADALIDVSSLARYFMVNDLIGNLEFGHPKSTYLYRNDIFDKKSPWVFGPVWDCDWAYGYESTHQFAVAPPEFDAIEAAPKNAGRNFFSDLMRSHESVKKEYYATWTKFMKEGGLDALLNFIDDYQRFAQPSLTRDFQMWYTGTNDYGSLVARMKTWLRQRAEYIYAHLDVYELPPTAIGQVGEDGTTAVEGGTSGGSARQGIFTLAGVRVNTSRMQLPAGIYIIDGRKVVVR